MQQPYENISITNALFYLSYDLLPLKEKIELTKKYIIDAISEFGPDSVYISYSGEKDSTVLSHIAKQLYPNILHIFADTTCEFPETIQHVEWETSCKQDKYYNCLSI